MAKYTYPYTKAPDLGELMMEVENSQMETTDLFKYDWDDVGGIIDLTFGSDLSVQDQAILGAVLAVDGLTGSGQSMTSPDGSSFQLSVNDGGDIFVTKSDGSFLGTEKLIIADVNAFTGMLRFKNVREITVTYPKTFIAPPHVILTWLKRPNKLVGWDLYKKKDGFCMKFHGKETAALQWFCSG